MTRKFKFAAPVAALLLAGCVSIPSGPGVMALPGTNKSFDQFRADDMGCRQYANNQIGGATPESAQADSAVKSAAIGTVLGAAAGALVGGHNSVAAGAGTGLLIGGVAGAGAGNYSGYDLQLRYDAAYVQCMYASGHKVPTRGNHVQQVYSYSPPPQPAGAAMIPPPPPGVPPGAPPGVN